MVPCSSVTSSHLTLVFTLAERSTVSASIRAPSSWSLTVSEATSTMWLHDYLISSERYVINTPLLRSLFRLFIHSFLDNNLQSTLSRISNQRRWRQSPGGQLLAKYWAFAARCYVSAAYVVMRCLSVCLSRSYILSKRINISSNFLHLQVATLFLFLHTKRYSNILTETTIKRASNARGVGINRDSDPISCFIAYCELCDGQLLSARLSADTRLSIDACWS